MAKNITIPILFSSPVAEGECTTSYFVEWKRDTDSEWNTDTQVNPDEVVITNLDDSTTYNIRITRFCCGGLQSAVLTINHTTGA